MPVRLGARLKRCAPSIGIGFAIAVVVWLLFYYRFPTELLGEMEFLAVWMIAFGCAAGARALIGRLRRPRPHEAREGQDDG